MEGALWWWVDGGLVEGTAYWWWKNRSNYKQNHPSRFRVPNWEALTRRDVSQPVEQVSLCKIGWLTSFFRETPRLRDITDSSRCSGDAALVQQPAAHLWHLRIA